MARVKKYNCHKRRKTHEYDGHIKSGDSRAPLEEFVELRRCRCSVVIEVAMSSDIMDYRVRTTYALPCKKRHYKKGKKTENRLVIPIPNGACFLT